MYKRQQVARAIEKAFPCKKVGEAVIGLEAVSYTHLDVYKRQTLQQRIEMIWYAICTCRHFGIDMNGHSAEAYTAVWTLKTAFCLLYTSLEICTILLSLC